MIKGIDISKWQGNIVFNKVATQYQFAIIKASEGVGYQDPQFNEYKNQIRNQTNLGLGFYHFARPDLGNSPESEAVWFCKVVTDIRDGEILCLDYEPDNYSGDAVNFCHRFLIKVEEIINTKPLIYINKSQKSKFNWIPVVESGFGLWLADYEDNGSPSPWPFIAIKQTTSSGSVSGISGRVDLDVFYGSKESFYKYGYSKEDPKMIEELQQQIKDKDAVIESDKVAIAEYISQRDDYKKQLDDYKLKVSDEFFQLKSDSEQKYGALELINKQLKDKITELGLADSSDVSEYQKLQDEIKRLTQEKDATEVELKTLKEAMGSEAPSKAEVNKFIETIKDLAKNPELIYSKFFPAPLMFIWKKWGKQHWFKNVLQKFGTIVAGSGLGATLWLLVDAGTQIAHQPIPKTWDYASLVSFAIGTTVIVIKVLKSIASKNEPLIKAIESINPALNVYTGEETKLIAPESDLTVK